jgi:hypothetical protein
MEISMRFTNIFQRAALAGILASASCFATNILTIPAATAPAGSIGNTFDITLATTGTGLDAFSFVITSTNPGITFTSASDATTLAYVFSGTSLFAPNLDTANGTTLVASDLSIPPVALSAGNYGLAHIFFDVASTVAPGTYGIGFILAGTSLADGGAIVGFETKRGSITVTSSVPEPASGLLLLGGLVAVWRFRRVSTHEN